MLIVFPIGLWVFSLACDLIRLAGASGNAWITVAYYSMVGALIGALCAAVPGLIDLICYKGGAAPAKKIALTHMTSYAIVGLDRNRYASEQGVRRGAYVLADAKDRKPRLILSGERLPEVGLTVAAAERLQKEGIAVHCVSMPNCESGGSKPLHRSEPSP